MIHTFKSKSFNPHFCCILIWSYFKILFLLLCCGSNLLRNLTIKVKEKKYSGHSKETRNGYTEVKVLENVLPERIPESQRHVSMLRVAFNLDVKHCRSSSYSVSHLPLISSLVVWGGKCRNSGQRNTALVRVYAPPGAAVAFSVAEEWWLQDAQPRLFQGVVDVEGGRSGWQVSLWPQVYDPLPQKNKDERKSNGGLIQVFGSPPPPPGVVTLSWHSGSADRKENWTDSRC